MTWKSPSVFATCRSRLQEPVKVLPSPRRASADQATPRFANRATPGRSGPLEKSPRSAVPKSGPISAQEEDPFKVHAHVLGLLNCYGRL